MAQVEVRVAALYGTPVKGLRLSSRSQVTLERRGVRGDRRFYLVDERARMVNGKQLEALQRVSATLDEQELLMLRLSDGAEVAAPVEYGETLQTTFFSRPRKARIVQGPFSSVLSRAAGRALRLVAPSDGLCAADRDVRGGVSLMSSASLRRLAESAGETQIDARRFRMTIEIDGSEPFAEDAWIGRELSAGEARISMQGHVGRCIVTSRDPDSGAVDLPTLDILRSLRGQATTTEPLAFGIYGEVVRPGNVRVGDQVALH